MRERAIDPAPELVAIRRVCSTIFGHYSILRILPPYGRSEGTHCEILGCFAVSSARGHMNPP